MSHNFGSDEQMFGAKEQVPYGGRSDKQAEEGGAAPAWEESTPPLQQTSALH
jgi:hypothetical protein